MNTTSIIVILAVIVVVGILGAVLVARSRRHRVQASQRMGLPPLGTLAGDPVVDADTEHPTDPRDGAAATPVRTNASGAAKPQPKQ